MLNGTSFAPATGIPFTTATDHDGQNRNSKGEGKDVYINFQWDCPHDLIKVHQGMQQTGAPPGQQQSECTTQYSHQQALQDELAYQPSPPRPEGAANSEFLTPGRASRQKESRHVGARDQQNQTHRNHEN